ncbi:MAG: PIN domain-containing protein [Prevotella sp.]|nr:PIN domain-containing protein [Prevotella sp.]
MKCVFLDTNILVDYALGREFGDDAEQLLQRGHDGEVSLMASYLTFANMAYILRTKVDIYALLEHLSGFIKVLPMDNEQLHNALGQRVHDFEDMLQYQCAKAGNCDVIITNNKHDFAEFCELPFMTAAEFMADENNV